MKILNREVSSSFVYNQRGFNQHFLDWRGGNPVIIMLHPKRSNSHHWDHLIYNLKNKNRIIAPDLRGHGLSDYPDKGYSVPDLSKDTIALIDQLGVDDFFVVGCATGGNLAIWLAAMCPGKVRGIAVIDPGLSVPKDIAEEVKRQTIEEHNFRSFEEAKSSMHFQELWSDEVKEHYAKYSFKQRRDGRWEWLYAAKPAREISDSLEKDSVWDLSKKVNCKTVIIRGEHSPVFTEEHMTKLNNNMTHAESINLVDSSHTPAQENPAGLAREIQRLID